MITSEASLPLSSSDTLPPTPETRTSPLPGLTSGPGPASGFDPTELLSQIWRQNLPLMRDRVACLRRTGVEARNGSLAEPSHVEASDLAHKLAGSLGMFGFPRGTEIAREIERLLEAQADEGPLNGEYLFRLTEELYAALPLEGSGA